MYDDIYGDGYLDDIYADGYEGDDYNEGDYYEGLSVGDIFDLVIELEIATYEELELVTGLNGYSIETLNDVIYYKTGYQDLEQYMKYE